MRRTLETVDDDINDLKKATLQNTLALDELSRNAVTKSMLIEMENKILRAIGLGTLSLLVPIILKLI